MATSFKKFIKNRLKAYKKAYKQLARRKTIRIAIPALLTFLVLVVVAFDVVAYHYERAAKLAQLSNKSASSQAQPTTHTNQSSGATAITTPPNTKTLPPSSSGSTQTPSQADTQLHCSIDYTNYYQTYTQSVINSASQLTSEEASLANQAIQQPNDFNSILTQVNADINTANSNISANWNTYFVIYKHIPGCNDDQPNVPSLLQVPSCNASESSDITDCEAQVDSSLNIT